jgi:hypothetical protein
MLFLPSDQLHGLLSYIGLLKPDLKFALQVFSKKVLPILEASLTADYVVDRVRRLTALL